MKTLLKVIGGLVLLALLTAVQPACVYACSCIQPGPPDEARASSTAVFSGKATSVTRETTLDRGDMVLVTFAVARAWKGPQEATIAVRTPGSSASCGFDFVEGQEYLVYAHTAEGGLQANLCSRTAPLAQAGADIAALGEGTAPAPAAGEGTPLASLPDAGTSAASTILLPAAVGGALLVVAIGAVFVVARRRH